jgi:ribonucleoside-diphosphate reductase alpha subunit
MQTLDKSLVNLGDATSATHSLFQGIVANLSKDLQWVNISLLQKDIEKCSKLTGFDRFEQLALASGAKTFNDPQWGLLAGRILMEGIYNMLPENHSFSNSTYNMRDILDPAYYEFVMANADVLDKMIVKEKDYTLDLLSIATLKKSYLAHVKKDDNAIIMETPQYMYLRVATFLHFPNLQSIQMVYTNLSIGLYSQASPTLFNAGMKKAQMSSCFLMMIDDDMVDITNKWRAKAFISQDSGGIGCNATFLRHSEIGQHGFSRGIVPWLKIENDILATIDQGGKRKGSGTFFLRDCHMDVYEFIDLRDEGPDDIRAKDLFLSLVVSDLFMNRVKDDDMWSLFCPNKAKGLFDIYGEEFETTYKMYEDKKIYARQVRARDLWQHLLKMQIKKGMPFILYIDAVNRKSNQKNLGTIGCSNLCMEIVEHTSRDEIASCVLGSISLNKYVVSDSGKKPYFFFHAMELAVVQMVDNLNQLIDRNYYSPHIPEIKNTNLKHRPLGIGVQGFADALALLDIAWVDKNGELSKEAKLINRQIFECIYYAAVKASSYHWRVYESFEGSPASKGLFQFDMWNAEGKAMLEKSDTLLYPGGIHTLEEWNKLRTKMMRGMANSQLIALMPTASSAHILGNNECFEPFYELAFAKTVLSGQFVIINKYMVADLREIGLWTTDVIKSIMGSQGQGGLQSIIYSGPDPKIKDRLDFLKLKYKTVYEIPQRVLLDMAADRGRFVCQSASQNCFMERPTKTKLNAYHFYAWSKGLKTGMYYLRQKAITNPINMSIDTVKVDRVDSTLSENPKVSPNASPKVSPNVECTDDVCIVCQT